MAGGASSAQYSDINMASGVSRIGPWWQHEPWTSSKTPVAVGPSTKTWPLEVAQAWTSPWLQVAAQTTQMSSGPGGSVAPWTSTWPRVAAQNADIQMALGSNMGHGHQHRPLIWEGHRPRHGPGHHHGFRRLHRLSVSACSSLPLVSSSIVSTVN